MPGGVAVVGASFAEGVGVSVGVDAGGYASLASCAAVSCAGGVGVGALQAVPMQVAPSIHSGNDVSIL